MNEFAVSRGYLSLDDLEEIVESLWPRFLACHIWTVAALTLAFELGSVAEAFPYLKDLWRPGCGRMIQCL